ARNALDLDGANSTEFTDETNHPVICMLEEQKKITYKGGTMRLGSQPCILAEGSLARRSYNADSIEERHRHRYEFNPEYKTQFVDAGMQISGKSPNGLLAEIVEIPEHPWFLAVQFHPEFKSKPLHPHALFRGFIEAALQHHQQKAPVSI
nr:CTP synthetase [Planctomycetota bacterium]